MKHRAVRRPGDRDLAARLGGAIAGDVLFDSANRGRYSTDASIYQIEPLGVVIPRTRDDIAATIEIAKEAGVPVLPRGGGTSQCGQTVGEAIVVDVSRHFTGIEDLDVEGRSISVEPGVVLDDLNAGLKRHGLFFPVDVSTANRATLGGMAGNNSCGSRSIRYGNMVHNVRGIDAILADGESVRFGPVDGNLEAIAGQSRYLDIVQRIRALGARERDEIDRRFPKLLRRVGGYNIDTIDPTGHNMAHLLVGSEGTLGFFTALELALEPLPKHKVLGICHFDSFYAAMQAPQHIVGLDPTAVELVDKTLLDLAYEIDLFRPTLDSFVEGDPKALLFVEFAGDELAPLVAKLDRLDELMADLGLAGALVKATDTAWQTRIWDVRKQGLNIVMSMKGDGKPVSFVEDCSVRLTDLPEYTRRLDEIFRKHGTEGTWYAHASVGTLHVRPILNLKEERGARQMRAIAEECFAMVREYEGSHSGEHGDGLVRSEFHEPMFGRRLVDAFGEVKSIFDPEAAFNPGKIVDPERMDDRSLFRFKPDYQPIPVKEVLDWSAWGGLSGAVEMCNNNGACRKSSGGVMCPSYRATMDEEHLTRGRANTLRLALSGQLDDEDGDPLASETIHRAFELCVSCKGCRRECPTGVDMARMKIEHLASHHAAHGWTLRDKMIGNLPGYARFIAPFAPLLNLRNRLPVLARASERWLSFPADRALPTWHRRKRYAPVDNPDVMLFVDTFTRWFEPDLIDRARRVLERLGFTTGVLDPPRPLCCGRTHLATGLVDRAKAEALRTREALLPFVERGIPIVALEPSCLFTFHDEHLGLLEDAESSEKLAAGIELIDVFLADRQDVVAAEMRPWETSCHVHGHCHQKAFGVDQATNELLRAIPGLDVEPIESSCCGMAGLFGLDVDNQSVSMAMGEAALFPALRAADQSALVAAAGTSCRSQIAFGTARRAQHPIEILDLALS